MNIYYHVPKSALFFAIFTIYYVNSNNGCLEPERIGLLGLRQLVESNGADSSKLLPDWAETSPGDCCEWNRVTCDNATGHVTELHLRNLKDIQSINEEDGMINDVWSINCSLFLPFTELRGINLSFNSFAQWDENYGKFMILLYVISIINF